VIPFNIVRFINSPPSQPQQIAVKAYYIARGIDVSSVQTRIYPSFPSSSQSKSVTIALDEQKGKYISIFQYGSVVLFNVSDEECHGHLANIKQAGVLSSFAEDLQEKEEYEVLVLLLIEFTA